MTEKTYGAIVARRGKPESLPWAVGDRTDVYVLLDPADITARAPIAEGQSWDAHGAAVQWGARLTADRKAKRGREVRRFSCTCRKASSLVVEYVDAHSVTWAIIEPERIPAAFRRVPEHEPDRLAMPLHRHPNGSPHIEITTCRRCNQVWAVILTEGQIQVVRVRPTRGGTVAP